MDEILKMAQRALREHTKVCDRRELCGIFKISPPCNALALTFAAPPTTYPSAEQY